MSAAAATSAKATTVLFSERRQCRLRRVNERRTRTGLGSEVVAWRSRRQQRHRCGRRRKHLPVYILDFSAFLASQPSFFHLSTRTRPRSRKNRYVNVVSGLGPSIPIYMSIRVRELYVHSAVRPPLFALTIFRILAGRPLFILFVYVVRISNFLPSGCDPFNCPPCSLRRPECPRIFSMFLRSANWIQILSRVFLIFYCSRISTKPNIRNSTSKVFDYGIFATSGIKR